ncbi:hypothetical protein Aduo_000624 [Ancylostoma duodenale]
MDVDNEEMAWMRNVDSPCIAQEQSSTGSRLERDGHDDLQRQNGNGHVYILEMERRWSWVHPPRHRPALRRSSRHSSCNRPVAHRRKRGGKTVSPF